MLYEKENELVAQFMCTVLLMPNGPHKITGLPFNPSKCTTSHSIEDTEIQALLKTSANPKSGKKKKKTTKKAIETDIDGVLDDKAPKTTSDVAAASNKS